MDLIRQEHINAARESVRDPDIRKELEAEIESDCDWLRSFLFASQVSKASIHLPFFLNHAKVIDEISPRSRDSIIGLGERLACKFMTAVLRDQGIDAEYVSLENIVPEMDEDSYADGSLDQAFYDRLAVAVGERIEQCGQRVPVVTGFFGPVPARYCDKSGGAIRTYFPPSLPSASKHQSYKSGKRSMVSSPPTRARWPRRA